MSLIQTLIAFLVALAILIFFHELGHYMVARWCGVKILRFSIGFGRPLLTRLVGPDRTEWSISALPLGGYVKMLDERESPDEPIDPAELHRAFNRQSLPKRAAIVAAGPLANFLLAIALYWLVNVIGVQEPVALIGPPPAQSAAAMAGLQAGDKVLRVDGSPVRSWNEVRLRMLDGVIEHRAIGIEVDRDGAPVQLSLPTTSLPEGEVERDFVQTLGLELASGRIAVASVLKDSPAAQAGLQAGDEVVSLEGRPVRRASELIDQIRDRPEHATRMEVRRDGVVLEMTVTPQAIASDRPGDQGRRIGRIGAGLSNQVAMQQVRYGPIESVSRGAAQTWEMSVFSLRMIGKMLVGELSWRNLSGPVAIADYAGQSARIGWYAYVSFLALISISLGVLNLLPIPVLDGGHLVYYALEALRGKPLSERFMIVTQKAGLAAIGALMIIALFNDITRLIGT